MRFENLAQLYTLSYGFDALLYEARNNVFSVPVMFNTSLRPGTSGLRRPTLQWNEPGFLCGYFQVLINVLKRLYSSPTILIGGDGRLLTETAATLCAGVLSAVSATAIQCAAPLPTLYDDSSFLQLWQQPTMSPSRSPHAR
jgi:hypothetical protein